MRIILHTFSLYILLLVGKKSSVFIYFLSFLKFFRINARTNNSGRQRKEVLLRCDRTKNKPTRTKLLTRAGSALRGLLAAERLSFARPLTTACGVGPKGEALKEHDYPNTCPRWLTARGGFLRCVWTTPSLRSK